MRLLILSDLHIGNKHNIFQWDDNEFIDKVSSIISQYEIDGVILNGDIYDLYKFTEDEIREQHKEIIEFLSQFIYIRGNHDWNWNDGLDNFLITNSKGQKIYFEHGHLQDFLNGFTTGRFIATRLLRILRKLLKFEFVKNIYNNFVDNDSENIHKHNRLKYIIYAFKLFANYDIVCLGHVHKAEVFKTFDRDERKIYLNSGTCSQGKFQAIVFNTETLEALLIKENNGKM